MLVTLENISSLRPHPNRLIQPNHFPIQHLGLNDVLRQRHVFIRPPKSRGKRNLRTQRSKNLVRLPCNIGVSKMPGAIVIPRMLLNRSPDVAQRNPGNEPNSMHRDEDVSDSA